VAAWHGGGCQRGMIQRGCWEECGLSVHTALLSRCHSSQHTQNGVQCYGNSLRMLSKQDALMLVPHITAAVICSIDN